MSQRANARDIYPNAAEVSKRIEKDIDNFLMKNGSRYPVAQPVGPLEGSEPPKGSALYYLGKKNDNVPADKKRIIAELALERDVIGGNW